MSRELKFRVYIPEKNGMVYFDFNEFPYSDRYLESDKYPVQQYTGLKDIDNKEIYDGDLVGLHTAANYHTRGVKKDHYGLYEIYWDRKYKLKEIKPNWFFKISNDCCAADLYIMKVVGNVFETTELIK